MWKALRFTAAVSVLSISVASGLAFWLITGFTGKADRDEQSMGARILLGAQRRKPEWERLQKARMVMKVGCVAASIFGTSALTLASPPRGIQKGQVAVQRIFTVLHTASATVGLLLIWTAGGYSISVLSVMKNYNSAHKSWLQKQNIPLTLPE